MGGFCPPVSMGGQVASPPGALSLAPGGSPRFQLPPGHLAQALGMHPLPLSVHPRLLTLLTSGLPPGRLLGLALLPPAKQVPALNSLCGKF